MSEPRDAVLQEFDAQGIAIWRDSEPSVAAMADEIVTLRDALALATQRAEAAEARCVDLAAIPDEKMPDREWTHGEWMRNQLSLANETVDALQAERDALRELERDVDAALAPFGVWFMDPPDGGDVSVGEQVKRMSGELRKTTAERDALRKDAAGVVNVLGFFASAIKSGEPWTAQCEEMLRAAFAHRDAALAVKP